MFNKIVFSFGLIVLSFEALAAGYSNWAVPTQIEYVNDGILISGDFGNPSGCADENLLFISRAAVGNDKFQPMMSIVLTAFSAQKEIRVHSTACFNVSYHGQTVSESQTAVYIR